MDNRDRKRRIAHSVLVCIGILAFVTFIFRLWAILALIILGIITTVILLSFTIKKEEISESKTEVDMPIKKVSEKDVLSLAYTVILERITMFVNEKYSEAKWVFEQPDARQKIENGEDVFILLNSSGGYRRAKVVTKNLQLCSIVYQTNPALGGSASQNQKESGEAQEEKTDLGSQINNYELLAYQWVDTHIMELNDRCNEAVGQGQTELVLATSELPERESWVDICRELQRAEIKNVQCVPEGIKIQILQ